MKKRKKKNLMSKIHMDLNSCHSQITDSLFLKLLESFGLIVSETTNDNEPKIFHQIIEIILSNPL